MNRNEYFTHIKNILLDLKKPQSFREIRSKIAKQVPAAMMKPKIEKSLFYFIKNVFFILLFGYLILTIIQAVSGYYWLIAVVPLLLISFFNGILFYGVFSCIHDCVHNSFSKSKNINNFFGILMSWFLCFDFFRIRHSHLLHHIHNHVIGKDSKFRLFYHISQGSLEERNKQIKGNDAVKKIIYMLPFKFFRAFVAFYIAGARFYIQHFQMLEYNLFSFLKTLGYKSEKNHIFFRIMSILLFASFIVFVIIKFGFSFALFFYIFPMFIGLMFINVAFMSHANSNSIYPMNFNETQENPIATMNISNILAPNFINYFGNYLHRYHLEHHILPGVPHYALCHLHEAIKKSDIVRAPETQLNADSFLTYVFTPLIKNNYLFDVNGKKFICQVSASDFWLNQPEVTYSFVWGE